MATDVPFWRMATGAQARIASLVRFLESDGFCLRTFFLGQSGTEQFTEQDRVLIGQQQLDVDQRSSDQPPARLTRKLGWYAAATMNQLRKGKQPGPPESREMIDDEQAPLQLDDFRWPWAMNAFSEAVADFQPTAILIHYIKLGYLLDGLSEQTRNQTRCFVDTHDVLHLRSAEFRQRGFDHWIEVSRAEEARVLRKFDSIIAIQDNEAQLFHELAPDCDIVICGHATDLKTRPPARQPEPPDGTLSIGYLGSINASNTHAIESFLKLAWRRILESDQADRIKLVIAGEICDWIASNGSIGAQALKNVQLLGTVSDLNSFYNLIDLAINPVEFGTGLKIKNCEAIAYGKPLLTTTHGISGMPAECKQAAIACDSSDDFAATVVSLSHTPLRLSQLSESATQLSQTTFSDQQVYSRLKQSLLRVK